MLKWTRPFSFIGVSVALLSFSGIASGGVQLPAGPSDCLFGFAGGNGFNGNGGGVKLGPVCSSETSAELATTLVVPAANTIVTDSPIVGPPEASDTITTSQFAVTLKSNDPPRSSGDDLGEKVVAVEITFTSDQGPAPFNDTLVVTEMGRPVASIFCATDNPLDPGCKPVTVLPHTFDIPEPGGGSSDILAIGSFDVSMVSDSDLEVTPDFSESGTHLRVVAVSDIPEPRSALLLGIGLLVVIAAGWSRQRRTV
jgi:hypothetical protein